MKNNKIYNYYYISLKTTSNNIKILFQECLILERKKEKNKYKKHFFYINIILNIKIIEILY